MLDLAKCRQECHDCVKGYVKKFKEELKHSENPKFEINCTGIPLHYIDDEDLIDYPDMTKEEATALFDPVEWAKQNLDWHCLDPDGEIWKRKDPIEYNEWREKNPEMSILGKSRYHRPCQSLMMRCTSRRKSFRIGRQVGKSESICVMAVYKMFTRLGIEPGRDYKILVITPSLNQIELIFNRVLELIRSNDKLASTIVTSKKSPHHKIVLSNGSQLIGFTAGSTSKDGAVGIRGQKADELIFDEAAYLKREIANDAAAVITNQPRASVWMSSTPNGKRELYYESCFSESAPILTQNGLMPINKLKTGDYVFTDQGRYRKVLNTQRRYYSGTTFKINFRHLHINKSDFIVTPEHPYLTLHGWKTAKELTKDDFVCVPTRKTFTQKRPIIKSLPFTKFELKRKEIINCQLKRKDVAEKFSVTERTVSDLRSKHRKYGHLAVYDNRKRTSMLLAQEFINSGLVLTKDFYRLAGYYLAEGSIHRYHKHQYYHGITFAFHIKEKQYINEVVKLIKNVFNINPVVKETPLNNKTEIIINKSWVGIAFNCLFGHSEQKSIPEFMLNNPYELDLKETLFNGDSGHVNGKSEKRILALTAKKVVLQIYDMLLRYKIPCTFSEHKQRDKRKDVFSVSELNTSNKFKWWLFKDNNFFVQVKSKETLDYYGYVYNCEVEDDHTYTIGLACVHNCHDLEYKEFHYPSNVNPLWNDALERYFRKTYTEVGYEQEVEAIFGTSLTGVFQPAYVDRACTEYTTESQRPDPNWIYTIGVDWNDQANGTTIATVGYNPNNGRYRLVEKKIVQAANWTQLKACNSIAEMNKKWRPMAIYVDQGFGSTQLELLHKWGVDAIYDKQRGKKHPDAKLAAVEGYNFSSNITVLDPFTKMPVKKYAKNFMVENAQRFFENDKIEIPEKDKDFKDQIIGYEIVRISDSGRAIYGAGPDGDHMLDAFMLALVAFGLEDSLLGKLNYSTSAGTVPSLREICSEKPQSVYDLAQKKENKINAMIGRASSFENRKPSMNEYMKNGEVDQHAFNQASWDWHLHNQPESQRKNFKSSLRRGNISGGRPKYTSRRKNI